MEKLDLHIHSAYSDDGEFTVKKIMELCQQSNIKYMSITDHNTVKAIPEALALGTQMDIQVIAGVELDCSYMGWNFHLLGYHFDYTRPVFAEIEQHILEQEQNAAEQKIELIKKATGVPLCTEEVLNAADNGIVTGELIAEILLKKENASQYTALLPYLPGNMRSVNPYVNFYWDYFAQGKPAYVPIEYITIREAIDLIHAAGGIVVLAHPGQNLQHEYSLLQDFITAGIDGIEAYSSYHGRVASAVFDDLAVENNLLVTCGSDFHGKTKPGISLCCHNAEEKISSIITALKDAHILN